jgi:hypothetical protein
MQGLKKQMKELSKGPQKKTSHGLKDALDDWGRINRTIKAGHIKAGSKHMLNKSKQNMIKDKIFYTVSAVVDGKSDVDWMLEKEDFYIAYAHFSTLALARALEQKIKTAAAKVGSAGLEYIHPAARVVQAKITCKAVPVANLADDSKEELCKVLDEQVDITVKSLEDRIRKILDN